MKLRIPPVKNLGTIIRVLLMQGVLEFRLVTEGPFPAKEEALQFHKGTLPAGLVILESNPRLMGKGYSGYYIVKAVPVITGRDLEKAGQSKDHYGSPCIELSLTPAGAKKMEKFSSTHIGHKLAIVLNNRILSAPFIQDKISGEVRITGRFDYEETKVFVLVLNSGGLSAPVTLVQEKTIESPGNEN